MIWYEMFFSIKFGKIYIQEIIHLLLVWKLEKNDKLCDSWHFSYYILESLVVG